ncbi:MAG: hypothetical protein ACT4PJ_05150 [Gemmatimonadaceae bacterium]
MRTVRWLSLGFALATVLPSGAMAQEGRLFKNAWFWGAKAGITSFSTDRVKNAVAPSLGVEWLITRTRGGLYVSYDQSFFSEETTIFTSAYGPHRMKMENMRRLTIAGLAFPFNIGTLRPYGGVGLALNFIQDVSPIDPITSADQELIVARRAMDTKDRAAFIAMVGVQLQYLRFSAFGQAAIMPAQARFMMNSRPVYHLEGGIRWNVGSAVDRPD